VLQEMIASRLHERTEPTLTIPSVTAIEDSLSRAPG
jgi:hypothetical protein